MVEYPVPAKETRRKVPRYTKKKLQATRKREAAERILDAASAVRIRYTREQREQDAEIRRLTRGCDGERHDAI